MRELFVYYRVRADGVVAARERVESFQSRLRAEHPGLSARLLRRDAEGGGSPTWMEAYAMPIGDGIGDGAGDGSRSDRDRGLGITPALEAEIASQASALQHLLDGVRTVEAFIAD